MKVNTGLASHAHKIIAIVILAIMLFTASSVVPALAETQESYGTTYESISVDIAYDMITNGSFPDLVVLDVRYQYEYDMGHLYDAVLIPRNELETRIGELEEFKDHEIIVYCWSGYRSQIACEILVEYNFTKVFNMLGGILAWIDAGYPIWTTFHHVTVNIVDEEILLQIKPLLLLQTGCIPCAQNQMCPSGNAPTNITFTVLEQEESHTVVLLAYEVNGTTFEFTIAKTLLWSYNELTDEANRTANFILTEIIAQDSSLQFYSLSYLVQHLEYNLTLRTTLSHLNSETYNSSFTVMNYVPSGNSEVTSLEFVEFNSSVSLSQMYAVLGKVAKEMGKVYDNSEDETLAQLAQSYYTMKEEAKNLSKLVEKQLQQYNHEILQNSAVLMDMVADCYRDGVDYCGGGGGGGTPPSCTIECWSAEFLVCLGEQVNTGLLQCGFLCVVASLLCGPGYPICLEACLQVCGFEAVANAVVCAIEAMFDCGCL